MVWAGVSISGPTDLHIIRDDSLMAQRYVDNIRRPQVITYVARVSDSFLLTSPDKYIMLATNDIPLLNGRYRRSSVSVNLCQLRMNILRD
ncbi:hypothetical protein TNCV_2591511 [Trichonephila clavipes]|nr:hypothetical protein TNCV_2591511 [Trichonephila clavipes]